MDSGFSLMGQSAACGVGAVSRILLRYNGLR
jgi:hypothetical protein